MPRAGAAKHIHEIVRRALERALEMIPAIGAVSGAFINTVFMGHFQNTARGHFVIKRLEATHSIDAVREAYERL